MAALALQSPDYLFHFPPEVSKAQSQEAQQITEGANNVLFSLYNSRTYESLYNSEAYESSKIDAIMHLLRHSSGYASLSYLTRKTGLNVEGFHQLASKTDQFRKSLIVTEKGDEVYRLNKPFSGIVDIWKAFCNLNAMKY